MNDVNKIYKEFKDDAQNRIDIYLQNGGSVDYAIGVLCMIETDNPDLQMALNYVIGELYRTKLRKKL